jgi:hypothetical protein
MSPSIAGQGVKNSDVSSGAESLPLPPSSFGRLMYFYTSNATDAYHQILLYDPACVPIFRNDLALIKKLGNTMMRMACGFGTTSMALLHV